MAGNTLTDEEWLMRIHPYATEDELEKFEERVAIKMADGFAEIIARSEAWYEMENGRKTN